ncbi:hypothetical protein V1477_012033 [Vespula maculifrons]|uniref:Uncharacterized protein n=1 Tax=Vespula maculifrons TaxID=7453 RepID=A0ABD2C1L8_VESMC
MPYSPLLLPSGPRRMVHSSIVPKAANNCRTSSSSGVAGILIVWFLFVLYRRQREDLAANTENDKVTRLHQHPPS